MSQVVYKVEVPPQKGQVQAHMGAEWLHAEFFPDGNCYAWYRCRFGEDSLIAQSIGYVPTGVELSPCEPLTMGGKREPVHIGSATTMNMSSGAIEIYHVFHYGYSRRADILDQ